MTWKPIVVGVDASPEAGRAAALGAVMAEAAGTTCHLVHAARDTWTAMASVQMPEKASEFTRALLAYAREDVLHALWGVAPPVLLEQLEVRAGKAPVVLRQVAAELGAGLLVLGGKHHSPVDRWLHGSTALYVARTSDIPILVTTSPAPPMRVLVAVDTSGAARPTLAAAERYAALFQAELRALSIIEPLPVLPEMPTAPQVPFPYDLTTYQRLSEELLHRKVWPLIKRSGVERLVRHGPAVETILEERQAWAADLLVVGSHGKGWVERALLGSVTETLLKMLPASVLVVPVHGALDTERPATTGRAAPRASAVEEHV